MLQISVEDILRRLRLENPWWNTPHAISASLGAMTPRAYLDLFLPLVRQMSVRRAVVLMGPRRVGKTVMIHHAIQALLADGVPPWSICYISVDSPIYNGLSIEELIEHYQRTVPKEQEREAPAYLFFDEIQYLRKWEVQLKSVVDTHKNLKCIASGSAAAALKLKSEESGAGRFTDFLLPPLTFFEYLTLLGKTNLVQPAANRALGASGTSFSDFEAVDITLLNEQFLYYLNLGGYPEVIFSEQIQSDPTRFIKSDIIDKVLLRDLPSLYGIEDIQELNYLFTTLAFNTANEISLGGLSQNSGVAKNTIKRYIDYLEAAFLIKTVHRVDHNSRRFKRANFFKIYLTNPSMRAALFAPVRDDDKAMGDLAETAIFSQWFHSDEDLHYARWNDGEVDMVSLGPHQKPLWAVEVKWSDRYCEKPDELESLATFMQTNNLEDVLVTSRTKTMSCELHGKTIRFVPTSVYCYLVGHNLIHGRKSRPGAQWINRGAPGLVS